MQASRETFPILLWQRGKENPGRVAMRVKKLGIWHEYTWEEYVKHVERFACGLIECGLHPGDRVAIFGENRPQWIFADMGIQMARGIAVGIHTTIASAEVRALLKEIDAKFIVVGDPRDRDYVLGMKEDLASVAKIIVMDSKESDQEKGDFVETFDDVMQLGEQEIKKSPGLIHNLLEAQKGEDVSMVLYTAGTTGPPKGTKITHLNGLSVADDMVEANRIDENDELFSYLPLSLSAERLLTVLVPIKVGCVTNFPEGPDSVREDLFEASPTVMLFTPKVLQNIANSIEIGVGSADRLKKVAYRVFMKLGRKITHYSVGKSSRPLWMRIAYWLGNGVIYGRIKDKIGLSRLRLAYCVGNSASPELLGVFGAIGIDIRGSYGAAEFVGFAFCQQGKELQLGTVGKALRGIDFRFAESGELLLRRRAQRFEGYYGRRIGADENVVGEEWVSVGDRAYLNEEEDLVIVGRTKDLFVDKNNHLISPAEVESKLKVSPYISEAIVFGNGKEYLTALIQVDFDMIAEWAVSVGLAYADLQTLIENPKVISLIDEELYRVNQRLADATKVRKFYLLESELDVENKEISASGCVRRDIVQERFSDVIESMYR